MFKKSDLHEYQNFATDHILNNRYSMQWIAMGLGKTAITLTAIDTLLSQLKIKAVLIVAPLRVCQTVWRQEAQKWRHTQWLTFSLITGDADSRRRAIRHRANIYLINYENLTWLQQYLETTYTSQGRYYPFDMIVFDEISKLKNARTRQGAERGKAALKMLPYIPRRIGLTGTPSSNGMLDLFGQFLVLDGGQRLGTSFTEYRTNYFVGDHRGFKFTPGFGAVDAIKSVIGDITLSMRAKDYLDMPEIIINDILLTLPPPLQETYDAIEAEMIVQLQSGGQVEVFNQASLINRCLQYSNGAIYTEPGMPDWEHIHDVKLDALADIIEELAGQPVLVAFEFQHDAHKIMKRFPKAVWFSAKMTEKEAIKAIDDFKSGQLQMLIGHPGSMGHGLDGLQGSCFTEVLYGLNWSLDLMQQTIARVWRQGQKRPVIIHRLLMDGTTDLAVRDALERKASDETSIKTAVMDYWRNKT